MLQPPPEFPAATIDPNAPDPSAPLPGILECGFVSLLAGASGIGKTALIAGLATAFRDGTPIFGHKPNSVPAIGYITADRPWADSRQWFETVGFPEIRHYSVVDDRALKLIRFRNKRDRVGVFLDCLARMALPAGSLVFVDPIAIFLGGNLLDYDAVAMAGMELHRGLEAIGNPCVVGVVHSAKQLGDAKDRYLRPQDRILGSMALLGYTATQMYLMSPEEAGRKDKKFTFLWNPHHHPQQDFLLSRNEKTGLFVFEESDGRVEKTELTPDLQALLQLVPLQPESVSMHSLMAMFVDAPDRTTVWRRLKKLEKMGYVRRTESKGWQQKPWGKHETGDVQPAIESGSETENV